MTVYGINATDRESPATWADVKPTIHPMSRVDALALSAYKLADDIFERAVENGETPDWMRIGAIQDAARDITRLNLTEDQAELILQELEDREEHKFTEQLRHGG